MSNHTSDLNFYRPDHYLKYPIVLKSASGSKIRDVNGREYLDFFSAMGTVNCGHNQPAINRDLIDQINTIWTSSFFPTETQLETISRINSILPEGIELANLYSTGSEAIDHAIRLARAATGKKRIMSFREHYHGKTHGTLFLVKSFPECYGNAPDTYRSVIDDDGTGTEETIARCLDDAFEDDVAAVIFEPVNGYSGPRRLNSDLFRVIRDFCDRKNILMMADEILTGFFRCRGWFLSGNEEVKPDIIILGKGLGNGFPVSGLACTRPLFENLKETLPGSTFAGNSLACSVAGSVIDFMAREDFVDRACRIDNVFREFFSDARFQNYGVYPDGMGGLLSLSLEGRPDFDMQPLYLEILKAGVIASHTRSHLRIIPPLTIASEDYERGLEIIGSCIDGIFTR